MLHIHTAVDGQQLAHTLADTPETTIAISQLRRGLAQAWLDGPVDQWQTAVVEDLSQPGEPILFGTPQSLFELLPHIPNWYCLNVSADLAPTLAPQLSHYLDCPVRQLADIYHTLTQPTPAYPHPQVRFLTPADLPLLLNAPLALQGPQPQRTLSEMGIAGAVIGNQLVSIAQNYARTATFGEIGVHTLPEWRQHGLATAVAALIAAYIQSLGLVPVWSCGEQNQPSRRLAQKLGFRPTSHRVYLIPER